MAQEEFSPKAIAAAVGSTAGLMIGVSIVINSTFGVFLRAQTQEFHWSRTEISASHVFYSWTMALLFPLTGWLMDRYGVRRVVIPGIIAFVAAIILLSMQTGSILFFYAIFILLGACAAMGGQVAYSKVVSGWFHQRRGLVLAAVGLGATLAGGLMPQYAAALMKLFGWRGAYLGLAAYVLLIGLPLVFFFVREAPGAQARTLKPKAAEALGSTAGEARRSLPFAICVVATALCMIINTGIIAHVVPLLTDRRASLAVAVQFQLFAAIGGAASRLLEGVLLDRIDTPKLALPFIASAICGILLLVYGQGTAAYMLAGVLFGAGIAGETAIIPYFFTRFFGLRAFGAIYGTLWSAAAIASGLGPVVMGWVFDHTGGYEHALLAACGALVIVAALLACLPGYRYPARMRAVAETPDAASDS